MRKLVEALEFCVFDLETTGLDPEAGAEPIEAGAVRASGPQSRLPRGVADPGPGQFVEAPHAVVRPDAAPALFVPVALDVDGVQSRVPRGAHVAVAVSEVDAPLARRVDADVVHGDPDRVRGRLPPRLVRTREERIEAASEAEAVGDRAREELRAVGDDPHGYVPLVEVVEQARGVVVKVRGLGPRFWVLDSVERRPERPRVEPPLAEQRVARARESVPQQLRLPVGELVPDPGSDPVEHLAGVRPLRVDDRAVEVEQPEVVRVGDHRRDTE